MNGSGRSSASTTSPASWRACKVGASSRTPKELPSTTNSLGQQGTRVVGDIVDRRGRLFMDFYLAPDFH